MSDKNERNKTILTKRAFGLTINDLAKAYNLSANAIFDIVKGSPYIHARTRLIGLYIYDYVRNNVMAPTTREIAANAVEDKVLSTSIVDYHLKKLVKHGLITMSDGTIARGISIPFATITVPDFDSMVEEHIFKENNNNTDL